MSTDTFSSSEMALSLEANVNETRSGQPLEEQTEIAEIKVNSGAIQALSHAFEDLNEDPGSPYSFKHEIRPHSSGSTVGSVSQSLDTIEFEIFKITEMARRWIVENGLSPYKLALTAETSPSQVHRIMEPGWTPSLKLARRIASSLPEDWVSSFERDCNTCLPRLFYLQPSSVMKSAPINQVMQAIDHKTTEEALADLVQDEFNYCRYNFLSKSELSVQTARHHGSGLKSDTPYMPPAPRLIWEAGQSGTECRSYSFSIHRIPLKSKDRTILSTVHIVEFDGQNWAIQLWKIENSRPLTDQRQLDILAAYQNVFT
ncbi:hypothetical protein [Nisaea sediminum]|uniref:hypothetical protein n=1 Tax=Nisaea sediminum TaxID=2775867 RepID=UPI0018676401|nr:hypothetical protein [Nisaea sediminum]